MTTMLDNALSLVERGFKVFPLQVRDKNPLDGSNGFKNASNVPQRIKAMWGDADYNIGIATGHGFCVIDIDNHNGDGMANIREWEREHGELPETVSVETGSGGEHWYYKLPDGVSISNSASKLCPDVDLRGVGGYVVAPPSIHPNGNPYIWINDPEEFEMAVLPQSVIDALSPSDDDLTYYEPEERVVKGGRDDDLFRFISSMRTKGMSADVTEAAALARNKEYEPPFDPRTVKRKVQEVFRRYSPGLSEKGKAAKAETLKPSDAEHVNISKQLITQGMAFIDGVPAVFVDGVWRTGWKEVTRAILLLSEGCKKRTRTEVREYLEAMAPRVEQADPKYIAFKNGVLDIETMELLSNSGDLKITNVIPHDWNPDAESDAVFQTIENMSGGDTATMMNLQEVMGLCMYRSNSIGQAVVLLGPGGNGKSTYIWMLQSLLGLENTTHLDIQDMGERFMAEHLAGKLADLADDISNEFVRGNKMSMLKKVITGDMIFTDVKNGEGYDFKPYCTVVISVNEFPHIGDASDGTMRRLHPLEFNVRFTPSMKGYDPDIRVKLSSEEACEYMARLGVEGLKRVLTQKRLTPNEAGKRIAKSIKLDSSSVLQWIDDDEITEKDIVGNSKANVYRLYEHYCNDYGIIKKASANTMHKEIRSIFDVALKKNKWMNGKSVKVYALEGDENGIT